MKVKLYGAIHSGSDNSWKIRLWTNYAENIELCSTNWLDRPGINDWESSSRYDF